MAARGLAGVWLGAFALTCACGLKGGVGHPDAKATASAYAAEPSPSAAATAVSAQPAHLENADSDWREAARLNHWERAYELLGELPDAQRSEPTIRLALGAAALQSGHHAAAVAALAGLEEKLPIVRDEIRSWYARAAAVAGPYDEAAAILLASPKVADVLEAARAYQRGGKLAPARSTVDRAVRLAERSHKDEVDAHLLRAEIAEKAGDKATAAADLRWAVREHPERARDAVAAIERLGGAVPFDERLAVLERSASQGNISDTLAAFDALQKQQPVMAAVIAFARGKALYRAREYTRAVAELDRAAALKPDSAAEAKYYAARAAARAGQEVAAEGRFGLLARTQTRGVWGERASLRNAEMLLQLGRYREAASAFGAYLSSFKRGDESAQYGRAIALLGSGDAKRARDLLAAMRRRASSKSAGILQELEGVAAEKSGDRAAAVALWLGVIDEQPLTWASMTARARLASLGHTPLPEPIIEAPSSVTSPLPLALPEAPELLRSLGLDAAAEKRLALMENEAAQGYPGRESEALCELYGQLTPARRRQQIGERAASLKLLMRAPNNTERWAWQCVYPAAYAPLVEREEDGTAVPRGLVRAVIRQESTFEPTAVSPVGARGLMQLMPYTASRAAEELGLTVAPDDVNRPDVNIHLGTHYLGKLLRSFDGSLPLAVAAYNAGPHAVRSWLETGGDRDADLWVARIPYRETRNYVAAVLTNFARYQFLAGGNAAVTPIALELPAKAHLGGRDY